MLNSSDYLVIAGIAASPTVAVGLFVISSMRSSRQRRDEQHQENQAAIAELKDDFGNRLTAVEVAIEHVIGWPSPHQERRNR